MQNVLEPVADGITVYIDVSDNGVSDDREFSQMTNVLRPYSFDGLRADTYTLREIVLNGLMQTALKGGVIAVELGVWNTIDVLNLGNEQDRTPIFASTEESL